MPLGELEQNILPRTRNGPRRSVADVPPVRRPRRRPQNNDGLTTAQRRHIRLEQQRVERLQARIEAPDAFISQLLSVADMQAHDLRAMDHECEYCQALYFVDERTSAQLFEQCCKRGDAMLNLLRTPPDYLRSLYEAQTPEARDFRKNIRVYNNSLAFTSVSYTKDNRLHGTHGIQCFSIHGSLFHYQGPLVPGSQELPVFAQLFFFDSEYATGLRKDRYPVLNTTVLRQLTEMLHACNPFIPIYRTARERLTDATDQASQFRLLLNPQIRLIIEQGADRRRENLPTTDNVAAVIPDEYTDRSRRDILLAVRHPTRNGPHLTPVHVTHAAYMPLHYVLLFPHGDYGWHYELQLRNGQQERIRTRLGQRTFYRFRLHTRQHEFSTLFYAGRLFQQYIVDAYVACEFTALDWLRHNQDNIRADVYNGLADSLLRQDIDAGELGRRVILPASFTGGDRYMQKLFQDSMAIVRFFGKPTFFVTFTANPHWPEIVRNLFPGQQPTDRPDLIARIFRLKVKELLADCKRGIFGPYAGHVYTIEYQKRGLPHMHLLLFLQRSATFLTPDRIDEVVCAELPDPAWDPTGELRTIVTTQMVHGPCGEDFPASPCMGRRTETGPLVCQKRFPKEFSPVTVIPEDRYPQYRRRDNGNTFTVRRPPVTGRMFTYDNRWVVPYNLYLLRKYRSHINVEVCATIYAVKYIHKYIYKGSDRITLAAGLADDEITRYVQGRYVGPDEGFWRLFEFPTHQEFPPIQQLTVHLLNQQVVYFADNLTAEELAAKIERSRSTLMAYFLYNEEHVESRQYLYADFPTHYTWKSATGTWCNDPFTAKNPLGLIG